MPNKTGNVIQFPRRPLPPMFCFGGCGTSIQVDKIKDISLVLYEDHKTNRKIPNLHFDLIDGSIILVDYGSIEEAEEVMEIFYKHLEEGNNNDN